MKELVQVEAGEQVYAELEVCLQRPQQRTLSTEWLVKQLYAEVKVA